MHRMGMFRLEGVKAIFKHLGIEQLTEIEISTYRAIAIDLTGIWIEGVSRDYVHKRSDGTTPVADIPCTVRGKSKKARKKEANAKRRKMAARKKEKEEAQKRREKWPTKRGQSEERFRVYGLGIRV